jgi:hypothetical protein
MSVVSITFLIGIGLIVVAAFGGGIEFKDAKFPTLPFLPRIMTSMVGCGLLVLCQFPHIFPNPDATNPVSGAKLTLSSRAPGADIQNGVTTIREVKTVLRHLGRYSGALNDDLDDLYQQAVADFQISESIDADGMVGPVTYQRLRQAWPEHFESVKKSTTADSGHPASN